MRQVTLNGCQVHVTWSPGVETLFTLPSEAVAKRLAAVLADTRKLP